MIRVYIKQIAYRECFTTSNHPYTMLDWLSKIFCFTHYNPQL